MNDLMAELMRRNTPKVNDDVMAGIAYKYLEHAEEFIDNIFRSTAKSFPPGLEYVTYERCTPMEEYQEVTRPRESRRSFNIAKSDLYMVRYIFRFKGEELPIERPILLPAANDDNTIHIGGTLYSFTPVLSDKVITPSMGNIFIKLIRDKFTVYRSLHTVNVDGELVNNYVVWCPLYRNSRTHRNVQATTRAETCIAHYLFAKYGFEETFRRYGGYVPVIGFGDTINENTHPKEDWVVYSSSGSAPKTYISKFYEPNNVKLAVPRDKYTQAMSALMSGFFYVVDHFPNRFRNENYINDRALWLILLGHIILSGHYGENKLYRDMEEHLSFLDHYVDGIIIEKLKETGRVIENFYDLMMLVTLEFNSLVLDSQNTINSVYGKSLEVLYHVLIDIFSGLVLVNYRLSKVATKREIRIREVREAFNRFLGTGAIYKLNNRNIIITPVDYSGDHKYFKVTGKITEQENVAAVRRGKARRNVITEDKKLDISMIETGNLLFLPKSNPTPISHINPFVKIDPATGTILENPELADILKKTKDMF